MENRKKEGEVTRTGPITPAEIEQIAAEMEHEVRRLRATSMSLTVLSIAAVTMDGITKFRKGLDEISRGGDNLVTAALRQVPKAV